MTKETVLVFSFTKKEESKFLSYVLYVYDVLDKVSRVSGVIENLCYNNANELKNEILNSQSDFVKDNWYALEVNTIDESMGGFVILHILKQETSEE